MAQSQVSGASPTQGWTGTCGHLLLAGLGSCQAGVCGPKSASSAEGWQERGSPGTWASSVLTVVKGNFPPDWQCFWMDGCPTLAQCGFWKGTFPLQVCQLPSTKKYFCEMCTPLHALVQKASAGLAEAVS